MRRRRKRRALKWIGWIVGVLGLIVAVLALIKIDDVVMAQGIVEPGQKIYIDSPLSRVIHQIIAVPGDSVKADQPVAQLYDGDLRGAVSAAEKELLREKANLESSKARLALLREQPTPEELKIAESRVEQARIGLKARNQELKRAEHLYLGERLWSQEDHERAKTNLELAQANLKVANENLNLTRRGPSPAQLRQAEAAVSQSEAALAKAQHNLEASQEALNLTTLRSPADGMVARQDLHPGMLAAQGQIVMIIAGKGPGTIISSWMPEPNAWKVRVGQTVEILSNLFADREGFLGYGEIFKVYGYAIHEGGARTFELEVLIKETPLPLKYGSTADLRIIVGKRSILKILLGFEDRSAVLASQRAALTPDGRSSKSPIVSPPLDTTNVQNSESPSQVP